MAWWRTKSEKCFKNINLSEEDVAILTELLTKGIHVFFQAIPEENPYQFKIN